MDRSALRSHKKIPCHWDASAVTQGRDKIIKAGEIPGCEKATQGKIKKP